MAKPILLVTFPNYINGNDFKNISNDLKEKIDDYHVLYFTSDEKDIKFEVLNAENLDPIDIEQLKDKVKELIK